MQDLSLTANPGTEKPEFEDRRKGRLHAAAADALRRRILTGELPPGMRLREVQLCEQLNVSRTPIREAFRTLAAEGLVDLLPNRSVVVTELRALEVADLFLVFGTIEGLAAELACEKITDEEIKEIGVLVSNLVNHHAQKDRARYLEVNQTIHRRTVEIADNHVLHGVWLSLLPRVERARSLATLDTNRWVGALIEHSVMFAALAARNGPELGELTRKHFLNSLPYLGQSSLPNKG